MWGLNGWQIALDVATVVAILGGVVLLGWQLGWWKNM